MVNIDIVIIGAGAAGYFAAIKAAELNPDKKVVLLEKTKKTLQKVKVSGGGRCNVTHACFDIKEMINNYPRGGKELQQAFSRFFVNDTIAWFKKNGVELHTEKDNRMFPTSNSSQTIIDCLEQQFAKNNGNLWLDCEVTKVKPIGDGFEIDIKNKPSIQANKIIITSGGSANANAYQWLKELGHQIIEPLPSLFTFNLADKKITALMGVSLPASVKIKDAPFLFEGPLLITHWGFSGPAILKLSAFAALFLNEKKYDFDIEVNFLPNYTANEILDIINQMKLGGNRWVSINKQLGLPNRLFDFFIASCEINPQLKIAESSNKLIQKFITQCNKSIFTIKGKTTFKEEFVTCGGIALDEIDFRTMQSKICKNIYFAGEVLNIDGITGGFNFQSAWTTAHIAGRLGA